MLHVLLKFYGIYIVSDRKSLIFKFGQISLFWKGMFQRILTHDHRVDLQETTHQEQAHPDLQCLQARFSLGLIDERGYI